SVSAREASSVRSRRSTPTRQRSSPASPKACGSCKRAGPNRRSRSTDGSGSPRRRNGTEAVPEALPAPGFGGGHPNALRRAVHLGGGFFGAGSSTTAQFRRQVSGLRTILAEEGHDPSTFPV